VENELDDEILEIAHEAAALGKSESEFMEGWPLLRVALADASEESLSEALKRIRGSSDWPWQPDQYERFE
jgi:hypothetical protein